MGLASVSTGAFIGTLICSVLVFVIGTEYGRNTSTTRLILSGLAISTIFTALTDLIISLAKKCEPSEKCIVLDDGKFGRCYLGTAAYSFCGAYFGDFRSFRIV